MREVAIIGTGRTWDEPQDSGIERWLCNGAVYAHFDADRLYFMDSLEHFPEQWTCAARHFPGLKISSVAYPDLGSKAYPLVDVRTMDPGAWFTSTPAYMIAHAILEGVDRIYVHGLHRLDASGEYHSQGPCLNYWIGFARGRGIDVRMTGDSALAQPFPDQSALYGYEPTDQRRVHAQIVAAVTGARIEEVIRERFGVGSTAEAALEMAKQRAEKIAKRRAESELRQAMEGSVCRP